MWYINLILISLLSCASNTECIYVNEHDTYELARMIQGECASCPEEERFALALVAKNRAVIWEESLQSVLDPNQFQGLCLPVIVTDDNGSRLGEVAEHKTSLGLQIFKLK